MTNRLLFAVLHLGVSKLEAVVERDGKHRKVAVTWRTKTPTDLPPETWAEMIRGELSFRDSLRGVL